MSMNVATLRRILNRRLQGLIAATCRNTENIATLCALREGDQEWTVHSCRMLCNFTYRCCAWWPPHRHIKLLDFLLLRLALKAGVAACIHACRIILEDASTRAVKIGIAGEIALDDARYGK